MHPPADAILEGGNRASVLPGTFSPTVHPPADAILEGGNRASDAYCHTHEDGVGNDGRRGEVDFAADILPHGAPGRRRHS